MQKLNLIRDLRKSTSVNPTPSVRVRLTLRVLCSWDLLFFLWLFFNVLPSKRFGAAGEHLASPTDAAYRTWAHRQAFRDGYFRNVSVAVGRGDRKIWGRFFGRFFLFVSAATNFKHKRDVLRRIRGCDDMFEKISYLEDVGIVSKGGLQIYTQTIRTTQTNFEINR